MDPFSAQTCATERRKCVAGLPGAALSVVDELLVLFAVGWSLGQESVVLLVRAIARISANVADDVLGCLSSVQVGRSVGSR